MKGWCAMLTPFVKTREADALGDNLKAARIRLENTANDLVKTLDEMLEATNTSNQSKVRQNGTRNKPDH